MSESRSRRTITVLGAALCLMPACGGHAPTEGAAVREASSRTLDLALCSPGRAGFSADSANPYFPFRAGYRWRYEGREGEESIGLEIRALDETEVVAGVVTRVVEERETVDGELAEISRNFFAQASDGTVCYFGEEVDIYEGGQVVSHEGAWRADAPGNRPGIFMPAQPRPGVRFQMESAPGVAEDEGKVVGSGPASVPAGTFADTVRIEEFNPLDGGRGVKVFTAGVGLVVDAGLELVEYEL